MSLYIDIAPENATPAVRFIHADPNTRKCLIMLILCIRRTFREHVPSEIWNQILHYCDIKKSQTPILDWINSNTTSGNPRIWKLNPMRVFSNSSAAKNYQTNSRCDLIYYEVDIMISGGVVYPQHVGQYIIGFMTDLGSLRINDKLVELLPATITCVRDNVSTEITYYTSANVFPMASYLLNHTRFEVDMGRFNGTTIRYLCARGSKYRRFDRPVQYGVAKYLKADIEWIGRPL